MAELDNFLRLGIRVIKIHPPHQLFYPNDYLNGLNELELLYRAAEANGIPVMFHTGTSIFPGARNRYGDPMYIDDVAVDFPQMKILMAHGGVRCGWTPHSSCCADTPMFIWISAAFRRGNY